MPITRVPMTELLLARVSAQARKIEALKQTIANVRRLRDSVLPYLPADGAVEMLDLATYQEKLEGIRRSFQALRARHAATSQFFREELERFRRELIAEIALIADLARAPKRTAEAALDPFTRSALILRSLSHPPDPRRGVIAAIAEIAGASAVDAGVVAATASSCRDQKRFAPRCIAETNSDSVFVSENLPMQWVGYQFNGGATLRFQRYALRSRADGWANSNNMKNWVLEVSQDGENWIIVDTQAENNDLNAGNATAAFNLVEEAEAKHVRVRMTGPSHSGKNILALSGFELFGSFTV
jgi:hypothetical protein